MGGEDASAPAPKQDEAPAEGAENSGEISDIVQTLEQHPNLVDQVKKYVDGMVKASGGEEQTPAPAAPSVAESKGYDMDAILKEVIEESKK